MKKTFVLIFAASSSLLFAKPANKTLVGIGLDPIENPVTVDKNGLHQNTENQFGVPTFGATLFRETITLLQPEKSITALILLQKVKKNSRKLT